MRIATNLERRPRRAVRDAVRVALDYMDRRAYSTTVATCARDAGELWIPGDMREVQEWLRGAERAGLTTDKPTAGAIVLYTDGTVIGEDEDEVESEYEYDGEPNIVRIGVVVCSRPVAMAIEGAAPSLLKCEDPPVQRLRFIDDSEVLCYIKPEATSI